MYFNYISSFQLKNKLRKWFNWILGPTGFTWV